MAKKATTTASKTAAKPANKAKKAAKTAKIPKPAKAAKPAKSAKPAKVSAKSGKKPKPSASPRADSGRRQHNQAAELIGDLLESPLVADTLAAGAAAALAIFVEHGLSKSAKGSSTQALKRAGKAAAAAMGARLVTEFDDIMSKSNKAKPEKA